MILIYPKFCVCFFSEKNTRFFGSTTQVKIDNFGPIVTDMCVMSAVSHCTPICAADHFLQLWQTPFETEHVWDSISDEKMSHFIFSEITDYIPSFTLQIKSDWSSTEQLTGFESLWEYNGKKNKYFVFG